jgi:hypothetical protein
VRRGCTKLPQARVASTLALLAVAIVYFQARHKWGSLVKVEYGGIGTVVGFVIVLYGSLFLDEES